LDWEIEVIGVVGDEFHLCDLVTVKQMGVIGPRFGLAVRRALGLAQNRVA
jgi:hypothetical protein